jgi:hypothetical protein
MRIQIRAGATPFGSILAGAEVIAAAAIRVLRLDQIPISMCTFRSITGLPCMSCGSTRALGRLARFDVAGAFILQPMITVAAAGILAWGIIDSFVYIARRGALALTDTRGVGRLTLLIGALFVLNWIYLLMRAVS